MGKGWVVKGYSAFSGDSAVLGGLCGERGGCPFAMVAGMEKVGATGGASSSPTKSESDSAILEGLVQARDGGEAIPPVVARIFSGDSTSPLTRDGHGCPKLNAQSFARMRNQQSVHMARMWCKARNSAVLEGYAWRGIVVILQRL